jgi:hypothetical protein
MCRRVQCGKCGKATFAGCGMHVEQVLGGVPEAERCQCAAQRAASDAGAPGKKSSPWWWPF